MSEKLSRDDGEQPALQTDGVTVSFQNKQDDLMAAIEVIDLKNRNSTRKTIHIMAVALVLYWSVDLIRMEPGFVMGWVMLAAAAALGVFVAREPKASNLRYTARYVQRAPTGTATVDKQGVTMEDGAGRDPYRYADGVKIYEYKNVLALDGGRKRFAMIPLDQLDESSREALLAIVRAENYEKVEPRPAGGFFKKK